jgi:UDP-arabinose 4-epimerase
MRILVIGGAGYIGSHAAWELRTAGMTPVIYDNLSNGHRFLVSGMEFIEGHLSDITKIRDLLKRVDGVLHFAGRAYVDESIRKPREYYCTNVVDSIRLLDQVVEAGRKPFIFSSSCAVYGMNTGSPLNERTLRNPLSPYASTKTAFEDVLQSYGIAYGLKYTILRYFNAAGADDLCRSGEMHDPEPHVIPRALMAANGDLPALEVFGDDYETEDGTCVRDYIHVSDLARAHVFALKHLLSGGESDILNLGTGRGASVRNIIREVEKLTQREVPLIISPRRTGDPPIVICDPSRAQEMLHWVAERSLGEMVASAWNWQKYRNLLGFRRVG